jgi:copper transport protein
MTTGIIARSASERTARTLTAFALVGVGLSLAASGHAATAAPQWLTRPAVFIHGVGVAYWVGALMPLLAMAWRPAKGLLPVLNRFSRGAVWALGLLVLTGLTLAVVQLETFRALIHTKYGIILSFKITLVALLLGLAALNRFRFTPALAAGAQNTRPLVRSILLDWRWEFWLRSPAGASRRRRAR